MFECISQGFCVRKADGTMVKEGVIQAKREALDRWVPQLPKPWTMGMEATMFTAWIYDHLVTFRAEPGRVKVAHSAMLKIIIAGKKKNDLVDARKISDLEAGQGLPPFPAPLCPLAAIFLRCAPDRFLLTKPNTFPHDQVASVATLRWCSGSSRNAVRLPSEQAFSFAGIPNHFHLEETGSWIVPVGERTYRNALPERSVDSRFPTALLTDPVEASTLSIVAALAVRIRRRISGLGWR